MIQNQLYYQQGSQYLWKSLINFPDASTQTPQGRLPPASQEQGISPNLATLGASLYAPRGEECTHSHSTTKYGKLSTLL